MNRNFVLPEEAKFKEPEKKFPLIPKLSSYNGSAPEIFWSLFPSSPVPKAVKSKVSHAALRSLILMNKDKLTMHQFRRGMKIADDIQFGAEAYQKSDLPPITVPNLVSAHIHGEYLTDKIASWIETGFVVGPFKTAPLPGFRSNQLCQIGRYRGIKSTRDIGKVAEKPEGGLEFALPIAGGSRRQDTVALIGLGTEK
jgi:hypothetical protein